MHQGEAVVHGLRSIHMNSLRLQTSRRAVGALFWRPLSAVLAVMLVAGLAGCGGASTEENPVPLQQDVNRYTGPAPATDDVRAFMLNVWDPLRAVNRCGACHIEGVQAPDFVRQDNVNLAYEQANTVVNLVSPQDSRMVTKVAGGHNCWLASNAACGTVITAYIEAWANGSLGGGGKSIVLEAPTPRPPGDSIQLPADSGLFATTVHPLLTQHCVGCHVETATPLAQSPFFATADANVAYEAAKPKIDLNDPANSRFVLRLREESHNCWSDCSANAQEMENAIATMAGSITPTQVDPELVTSMALTLPEGTVASGGGRQEANVIALYQFKTGSGNTVYDTSGVEPSLNLTMSGDVEWVGGWGIKINSGKAQGSTTASKKLYDLITATGEYSIEAWVVPANVSQEDANIISYSGGTMLRDFTLGQTLYNYDAFNRSTATTLNGDPALSTADADEDLQATLQHVVVTYDAVNGRRIYVNGEFTDDIDPDVGGTISDVWDDSFALIFGNEASSGRQWQGTLRLVAIHNRVLSDAQIAQNFAAGVGELFFLLFDVSDLVDLPQSYVVFEVSQFDSYSYLFDKPFFVSLDPNVEPNDIPIKGMRIGINGKEAAAGQAYANLDATLTADLYTPMGQALSPLGTVIALEQGAESDEFFLTFDEIGTNTYARTDPAVPAPVPPTAGDPVSDIGLRTFEEINATMSEVTGVPTTESFVNATYQSVKQQLPTVEDIGGFLAAHQMGVAQLGISYCNALVEGRGSIPPSTYFPGFDMSESANTAFPGNNAQIIDPLRTRVMNSGVATQPSDTDVDAELNNLIDELTQCQPGCPGGTTASVVKATCAAALSSAAMLIQ
jgi:hypothetical protein